TTRTVTISVQPTPPPRPTLFPYTTLFRSSAAGQLPGRVSAQKRSVPNPANQHEVRIEIVFNLISDAALGDNILERPTQAKVLAQDRKSTRLNSSHVAISYAVFCLKKKLAM